jgi:hypothetical protein
MKWSSLLLLLAAALVSAALPLQCAARLVSKAADQKLEATLESSTEAPGLDRGFWTPLAQDHDPRWFDALAVCRVQRPTRPNCRTVLRLEQALTVPGFATQSPAEFQED